MVIGKAWRRNADFLIEFELHVRTRRALSTTGRIRIKTAVITK
jgi:hypothetical protein